MNWEQRAMGAVAAFVTRRSGLLLIAGAVLTALAVVAASGIKTRTQMKDMLPEDNPQVQTYEEIDDLFAGGTAVIVTIESDGPDARQRMIEAAEAFVAEVRGRPSLMANVRAINLKLDPGFVTHWGLMLQEKTDLERTRRLFASLNLLPFITSLNDSFEETYTGDDAEEELDTATQENDAVALLNQLERFFTLLRGHLESPGPPSEPARELAETIIYGDLYGFNHDGTMLAFTISPSFGIIELDRIAALMEEIKAVQREVQARFPGLAIGFTGDVPIQAGEQEAMSFDMMVPSLAAVGVILVLFVFSFQQLRSILFILASLVVAIVLNYGFVGVTIREITMLTSAAAALLVGLGVDYGIAMVVNFNGFRAEGHGPADAMRLTFERAGLGIFLAAMTTAVAFFVMAITGSKAFAQFGLMLGTGILFCYLTMTLLLPGLLLRFGSADVTRTRVPKIDYGFLGAAAQAVARHRRSAIAAAAVVTAGLAASAALATRMEHDMMKLEPQDMPALVQYKRLMEKYEYTPFQSMAVAESVEQARSLTEALEKEPLVVSVNSLAKFLPPPAEVQERLELIRSIRRMPARTRVPSWDAAAVERLAEEVQRLEWNVIEIGDLSVAGLGDGNKIMRRRNAMVHEVLGAEIGKPGREVFRRLIELLRSKPELCAERLARLDAAFAAEMDAIVAAMARADRPMTIADLPESVTDELLAADGRRNLVVVYPRTGVFEEMDSMRAFNDDLAAVSPRITGVTQVSVAWLDEAIPASIRAAFYILAAIVVFLLASLRDLRTTLLAAAPLLLGMIWMLGLYPLAGQSLNFLNIVMIPLVIGMGIDYGIHFTHRYQIEGDIGRTYSTTGKAVWLCALTTMIGFGSLGLAAKFPSIASIGSILFFGIASCLAAALLVLPALLPSGSSAARSAALPEPRKGGPA